ncbi:DNA-binding transcriptional regulator, XRE-family HTH domain [Gracilibacillus ureilyticus]|uniref:DNA-binding transcriptional regulator, XRE-family HTH domain n=1 Tax=Gracilibacillus ureilyticus TaxID=531814 RepID=A0A1H9VMU9_9BACI|nr:helix-turn-helix transcriptional regulator [Gracilibacillus ureilyticus]SES22523.1 DNA-binding transcriptional regulator, XRE-family HTH domain [Gracilibacillus ureilyticus]
MATSRWGNRIKAFRKLKGYTQIQFAEELGISVSRLGDLERGKKVPSLEHLESIAQHLNISVEELEPKK